VIDPLPRLAHGPCQNIYTHRTAQRPDRQPRQLPPQSPSPPADSVHVERRQHDQRRRKCPAPPDPAPTPICAAPSLAPSWPSRSAVAAPPPRGWHQRPPSIDRRRAQSDVSSQTAISFGVISPSASVWSFVKAAIWRSGVSGPRPLARGATGPCAAPLSPYIVSNARWSPHHLCNIFRSRRFLVIPALYRTGPAKEMDATAFQAPAPLTPRDMTRQTPTRNRPTHITRNRASRQGAKPTKEARMALSPSPFPMATHVIRTAGITWRATVA